MAPVTRPPQPAPAGGPAAAGPHRDAQTDRTGACATPRRATAPAGVSGAPGTPPGALSACAAAAPRPRPASPRPLGRPGTRATTAVAGASLPAGPARAGWTAAHGAASPAQARQAGPEDNRTTGEVA